MHWQPGDDGLALKLFVQRLLRLRQQLLPWLDPENPSELSHQWHGVEIGKPDWASWSHCLAWSIHSPTQGPRLWCGMNAYYKLCISTTANAKRLAAGDRHRLALR